LSRGGSNAPVATGYANALSVAAAPAEAPPNGQTHGHANGHANGHAHVAPGEGHGVAAGTREWWALSGPVRATATWGHYAPALARPARSQGLYLRFGKRALD